MIPEKAASPQQNEPLAAGIHHLYRHRFPQEILARRAAVWKVLCRDWLSRYIPRQARVLEVGAGYCEFINNIEAAERVAVDLNPDTARHAAPEVTVYPVAAERMRATLGARRFDLVFISNFLEHCTSRQGVLEVLQAARAVLDPRGRLLILGPNFRYCYKRYFDYFDHHLALSEKAVVEALQMTGFQVEEVRPRTLPFTFLSHLPSAPWIVRLYLRAPVLWRVFGAQFFIVARPEA